MADEGKKGIEDDFGVFEFSNWVDDATYTEIGNIRVEAYFQGKESNNFILPLLSSRCLSDMQMAVVFAHLELLE